MNKKIIEDKKFDFGQWKTWVASRLIDLDRGIHILKESKDFVKDDLKEDLWKSLVSKCSQKLLLESLIRRTSDNDTLEVIQREMKRKAERDIKRLWDNHGQGD